MQAVGEDVVDKFQLGRDVHGICCAFRTSRIVITLAPSLSLPLRQMTEQMCSGCNEQKQLKTPTL